MRFATRSSVAAAGAALFLIVFAALPPAFAQVPAGSGCILDHCADKAPAKGDAKPIPSPSTDSKPLPVADRSYGGDTPGDFDFYVLSLSWSPGFCATGGAERARAQCATGANLGFVVHGLWPQYRHGYPADCDASERSPSRVALDAAKGLYPDEGLARHEWRMHGTCSGKSPAAYFADVRRARDAITIPPAFRDPHKVQTWAPRDLQSAFIAANPRLRPGMMSIECSRGRSVLREVRICFSKDLRNFVACPEVARHFCYGRPMTVPPVE